MERKLIRAQKRSQLINERKDDPAVLVDIPQVPGAAELEKSGATEEEGAIMTSSTTN